MMQIISRDLASHERSMIYSDYFRIFEKAGIPEKETKSYSLVAEEDGKAVGCISGMTDHQWFYLTNLWVEENQRTHGIGTSLLQKLEEMIQADGIKHIYLWTYGDANKRFYERNGFNKFAEFNDFYEIQSISRIGYEKALV